MNANPLFSVLIANYNNGKYLMEAIIVSMPKPIPIGKLFW